MTRLPQLTARGGCCRPSVELVMAEACAVDPAWIAVIGTLGGGVVTSASAVAMNLHRGDVDVPPVQLGEHAALLPNELASFLRGVLDPHWERSSPAGY